MTYYLIPIILSLFSSHQTETRFFFPGFHVSAFSQSVLLVCYTAYQQFWMYMSPLSSES